MRISTAGISKQNGKYLVALRCPGTSIGEKWEFPGGKVEGEENPEEALKREFMEEFSVDIRVKNLLCTGTFHNKDVEYYLHGYEVEIVSGKLLLSEHQEVRWCSVEEMEGLSMADSDQIILHCLLEREKTQKF